MPITADTPKLASELQMASYSFSGAAFVRFTNQDAINLSWRQIEDRFVLATAQDAAWRAHSLDRIQAAGDRLEPHVG
jgi:subtilisin family serine protease